MYRNVKHGENYPSIIAWMHIDFSTWEVSVLQGFLHLRIQLRHEGVEIRHLFSVIYSWRWPSLVKILDRVDPSRNFLWFLVCVLYRVHRNRSSSYDVLALNVLKLQYSLIFTVKRWLIKLGNTKVFFLTIRFWHLQAGVNLAYRGNVIRNKWLEFSIQIDLLRFVSLDVFE